MTRDEARKLLPFLANGTLEGGERREVEAMVEADAELAAELAALTSLRERIQDEERPEPGDLVLARLARSIAAEEGPSADHAPARVPVVRIWQAVAAVLLAAVVAQTLFLRSEVPGDRPTYALAGDVALRVAFHPDATEAQIRALLLDAGVEIVGGPSALGFYEIAPADGASLDEIRQALRSSPIVEAVEGGE